jgi:hypothetical protein
MSSADDRRQSDPARVDAFLDEYKRSTGHLRTSARIEELDRRIKRAALSLADTIEAIKQLSPRADITLPSEELRLERLICSIPPPTLPVFKFALDYDADYKDLEEYVFHDIDDEESQGRILQHLGQTREIEADSGIKVLTDVDDTLYANLVDERYPPKTYYPGVLDLYGAVKKEPFDIDWIPVTTLSARPNPIAGTLEEGSIHFLRERTGGRLRASALSGKTKSSVLGTIETLARDKRIEARRNPDSWRASVLGALAGTVPDFESLEREIGVVKFNNFKRYARVYPEYRFVFFGDSGQADALTARMMVTDEDLRSRVVATFIHDLGPDEDSRSPTFHDLPEALRITKSRTPSSGPGVIVFRNHIQTAVLAHMHLGDLVTAPALARVTKAALSELRRIDFLGATASKDRLEAEYREDAEDAIRLLERAPGTGDDVAAIRQQLA